MITVDYSVPIERLALRVLTLPTAVLNSFDRRVLHSILSGDITDSETSDLTADVLFHIVRGLVPLNLLSAGKGLGSEELPRICQQIMDSMKQNVEVDMK